MLVHIQALIDDAKCYEAVRQLRWPDGLRCPACSSAEITKRGFHTRIKFIGNATNARRVGGSSMI